MQSFNYTASIKLVLDNGRFTTLQEEYPGVSDLSISSRDFLDYNECVSSCRTFMDDMRDRVNRGIPHRIYKVGTEVNPEHNNGVVTLSKDWEIGEVSRLWIFDEKMEKTGQIVAIAQARIFGSNREQQLLTN